MRSHPGSPIPRFSFFYLCLPSLSLSVSPFLLLPDSQTPGPLDFPRPWTLDYLVFIHHSTFLRLARS